MKKSILFFFLLALSALLAEPGALYAQSASHHSLAFTHWKGALHLETPTDALLIFTKDSLIVYKTTDHSRIETMSYQAKDSLFTVVKASGQSDCDNKVAGTYNFIVKGDKATLTMLTDACDDRSMALTNTEWTRWKVAAMKKRKAP